MRGARLAVMLLGTAAVAISGSASADETIVYTYDELGRLVKSVRTGTVNDGIVTDMDYDPAGNRTDYAVAGAAGSTGNFQNEAPPSFSIAADRSAEEGNALTFTVTRSTATQVNYSVSWAARHGTTDAADYTSTNGTLTFSPQDTSKTFVVQTTEDTDLEADEIFYVDLTGASGGAPFDTATRTGTITNDDTFNNPPVANTDSGSVGKCLPLTINVIANDTDPDGDTPLQVVAVGSSSKGLTAIANSSSVTFTSDEGASGTATFTYTVRDTRGEETTGYVNVTITSFNGCQ